MVAVLQGQPVTLVCGTNLRSNPPSTIQWRDNNGTAFSASGRYVFGNGPDIVHLNVSSTSLSDNGTTWTCILNNGIFASNKVNIILLIIGKTDVYTPVAHIASCLSSTTFSTNQCHVQHSGV